MIDNCLRLGAHKQQLTYRLKGHKKTLDNEVTMIIVSSLTTCSNPTLSGACSSR